MERIITKLGLKADATAEEVLAKLDEKENEIKTLKEEKSSLSRKNEELALSVEGKSNELEKLREEYKEKVESQVNEEEDKPQNIFDELIDAKGK